jgi:Flp pilus assembly protein TadG
MNSDHHSRRQAGQSLVEFAMAMPLLFLLLIGVAETGNALNSYIGVISAAREGARLASRGNIYSNTQVRQVVEGQTQRLDLAGHGGVLLTVVKSDLSGFVSYTVTQLLGTRTSRFTSGSLEALYQTATTTGNHDYLVKERFVIVEVFYDCPTLTQILWSHIPVYSYTVMRISAAS